MVAIRRSWKWKKFHLETILLTSTSHIWNWGIGTSAVDLHLSRQVSHRESVARNTSGYSTKMQIPPTTGYRIPIRGIGYKRFRPASSGGLPLPRKYIFSQLMSNGWSRSNLSIGIPIFFAVWPRNTRLKMSCPHTQVFRNAQKNIVGQTPSSK